jgi:zinc transporter 5/7
MVFEVGTLRSKKKMERSISFNPRGDNELPDDRSSDVGYAANDRRLAYSRSFQQSHGPRTPAVTEAAKPFLDRTVSSIDMPPDIYSVDGSDVFFGEGKDVDMAKVSVLEMVWEVFGVVTSGNRQMKRLFLLIALNVLYSTTELSIGIFTGRVGTIWFQFSFCFRIESLNC